MNFMRCTVALSALLLLSLSSAQAQGQKKPDPATETQQPMIKSISVHNPIPAYLIEASEKSNDAIVRGEAMVKSGHASDAIAEFQDAINYTPTDGLAYQRLAEAYTASGKLNEAGQTFHKVLIEGFGPGIGNGVGGTADIWAEYALVLVKTGQPAEAIRCYNHAASLLDFEDSENHGGKPALKVLFPEIVSGDALPEQVQYTPEHLQALADSLLAYKQQGFWSDKEVLAHAQEAAKLYPDSAVTHYYLGEVLPPSNPEQKAAYKKAVELGDDATVAAAKERLGVSR